MTHWAGASEAQADDLAEGGGGRQLSSARRAQQQRGLGGWRLHTPQTGGAGRGEWGRCVRMKSLGPP